MNPKKSVLLVGTTLLASAAIFYACQKDVKSDSVSAANTSNGKAQTLNPLTTTCDAVKGNTGGAVNLTVCAGNSGASAGFSVQWETLDDFNTYGWSQANAGSYRCVSLSGVPGCAGSNKYNLGPNLCVTVNIGDNLFDVCGASAECGPTGLDCNTTYIFRAFAHNVPGGLKASDKSGTVTCTTLPCGGAGCTYTQGYWKTHTPLVCETDTESPLCIQWPVTILTLGTVSYDVSQLVSILKTPAAGNGLITLAHQLIAAKLNIASGSDDAAIASAITDADNLIGVLVIPSGSLAPSATDALTTALTNYNEGSTGPGHCK